MGDLITTCFFCQNLLSDYIEGILPSSRHQEITKHLEGCEKCRQAQKDLEKTISLSPQLKTPTLDPAFFIRLEEASRAGRRVIFAKNKWARISLYSLAPVAVLLVLVFAFPTFFPWLSYVRNYDDESNFARYFPLLQGATEIIEEQANWLHSREPMAGSLWEEGGMSPEEYEKAFQGKPQAGTEP